MAKTSPPLLSVQPSRGLLDERLTVLVVRNMSPVQHLTLHSLLQSDDGDYWEAFGHYTSDARGDVNVLRDVCLGGTYDGVEPMGLIWSLRPVPGSRTGLRFRKQHVQKPTEITISLYKHHVSEGFKEQAALASVVIERWYLAPGVQRVDVTEGGLTAALFLPPGPGPFPGLLDLWGGGGGLPEYRSSLLASHGYASLTLDYMTPKTIGGTTAHVGNDYFETAFTFLKEHPQVCSDRIAMMGLSFGASVMLGLSVYSTVIKAVKTKMPQQGVQCPMPSRSDPRSSRTAPKRPLPGLWIGPLPQRPYMELACSDLTTLHIWACLTHALRCLVSVSGSHVQPVRGTLSEILHEINKNAKNTRYDEENRLIWHDLLLPIPTDPAKKVDVGQLQCPLLLLVGEDDQNWPSAESAEDMKEMMERAGNSHLLTILSYPGTGHLIEPPYSPHTRYSNFIAGAQRKKVVALWGGETTPHSHAQEDAWNKTLHFLEENLYRSTDTSVPSSCL